ncbi:GntR family transcriptional regulator [Lactobacillus sp. ESL0791]|uniref:GntR family transcriptional regulator n=1 Tax=Lactobacillus sp. ESL0791 TaxID=2983234 RepID=UPI0023F9264F|nr:GntR family transcriptional regulator [Lactobacillus sp. ESL0791]MDF7638257.1 GntR family transcriptional regulator [Lactobacillus sp. ESL0791]
MKKINIEPNSSEPLYLQIVNGLKQQIQDGVFKKGEKIPTEEELERLLSVSRGTIRKAIAQLVNEGALEKIQGKGTFVTREKVSYPFAQEMISYSESMRKMGLDFTTTVLAFNKIKPDLEIKERLHLNENDKVFYLIRKRCVNGVPAILLYNWISVKKCPNLPNFDFSKIGLFDAIETDQKMKIAYGIRNFSAKELDADQAKILNLRPHSPILNLGQITFDNKDEPIECSEVLLRTDQYQISSVLYRK